MNYTEALEYINSFSKSGKPVRDLSRFGGLVSLLENPHLNLKFVHIAGTNGKGSVCEYIASALEKSGFKTGKFTSPYIICVRERIQINGEPISEDEFIRCVNVVYKAVEASGCLEYSAFEILTAIAFVFFKDSACDFVVLETGIGGRLDCTSIVTPVISVITSIDLDHCSVLGNTIAEIAFEKAGIIKPEVISVCSPFNPTEAVDVLKNRAAAVNSRLIIPDDKDITLIKTDINKTEFCYKGESFFTKMAGEHQAINAIAAIEALRALNIGEAYISSGLKSASVPARMEKIEGWIIDGAHNPSGASAAAKLFKTVSGKKLLITGMLASKDWKKSLFVLAPCFDRVIAVDFFSSDAVKKENLVDFLKSLDIDAVSADSLNEAVKAAQKIDSDIKAVCGSLYLCSQLRKYFYEKTKP